METENLVKVWWYNYVSMYKFWKRVPKIVEVKKIELEEWVFFQLWHDFYVLQHHFALMYVDKKHDT